MSRLRDMLDAGEFVITGEIAPPHGTDYSAMLTSVRTLSEVCHAINVTDNQGATLHLSSLAASRVVLDNGNGCEPIFQQTCRDRNRLALQSDLLAAWTLGLENVLVVTGDDPRGGDHPQAKGVFDLDSTLLIDATRNMNEGKDMNGAPLSGATDFFIGGALFPEAEPWEIALERAHQKINAGATFFQTQAITDTEKFARAAEALKPTGAKLIAGVLLFKSPRVINFINEKLAGLMVPDWITDRITSAASPLEESIKIATEQVRELSQIADGVHIMPLGSDDAVVRIINDAGLA
ncbi:MAG: 5,10-methylenetetrahydrofolate reductase [Coriobacteriia bacterium]|nr:5,10-methylenetetrahydrofolate reductase [Coriobacteriia bacterium]